MLFAVWRKLKANSYKLKICCSFRSMCSISLFPLASACSALRFFIFCRLREQETLEQKLEKKKKKKKNLKTSGSSAAEVKHEDFHQQTNLVCRDQLPAVSFVAGKTQPEFYGTEAPQQPPQPLSLHADGDYDFDEVVSTERTRSAGGTETTQLVFKSDTMRFDSV
jgi:hypothetical protein